MCFLKNTQDIHDDNILKKFPQAQSGPKFCKFNCENKILIGEATTPGDLGDVYSCGNSNSIGGTIHIVKQKINHQICDGIFVVGTSGDPNDLEDARNGFVIPYPSYGMSHKLGEKEHETNPSAANEVLSLFNTLSFNTHSRYSVEDQTEIRLEIPKDTGISVSSLRWISYYCAFENRSGVTFRVNEPDCYYNKSEENCKRPLYAEKCEWDPNREEHGSCVAKLEEF
jgi:hypothetical protein